MIQVYCQALEFPYIFNYLVHSFWERAFASLIRKQECGNIYSALRAHSSAVEQPAHNRSVPGSNPGGPTTHSKGEKMEKLETIISFLEKLFPPSLAVSSDPPPLQIKGQDQVKKILVALELNLRVFHQVIEESYDFLYLHHPPIWEPITSFSIDNPWLSMLNELCRRKISVLAHHTNLDSAKGGLAEQWIKILSLEGRAQPIEPHSPREFKVVTFVPPSHREKVLEAIFSSEGGKIGNYEECSFLLSGKGTFRPQAGARPFLGKVGEREKVEEVRIEVNVGEAFLSQVVEAIFASHPYEQPAIDVYPLFSLGDTGLGRIVTLFSNISQKDLEEKLSLVFPFVAYHPDDNSPITYQKIALCPGSGKSLLEKIIQEKPQVFLTGELSHHDIARLNLGGIIYYSIPHEEGERRALREVYYDLKERFKEQGLKVELNFEIEG
ncbi:MAG: hypothetical protein PWP57_212 [Candidatus Atribacteria bacterium]|nr:hypothetical protein [Candidatus Atribacteria bacterium]